MPESLPVKKSLKQAFDAMSADYPEYSDTQELCMLLSAKCITEAGRVSQEAGYVLRRTALHLQRAALNLKYLQGLSDKGVL